jgi:hypothetical protein
MRIDWEDDDEAEPDIMDCMDMIDAIHQCKPYTLKIANSNFYETGGTGTAVLACAVCGPLRAELIKNEHGTVTIDHMVKS